MSLLSDLEAAFGNDANYNIDAPEDDESTFPDGSAAVFCTNYARYIRRVMGERASLFGFYSEDNPASMIAQNAGGHDFAVVDGRYIVDPWIKLVAELSPVCVIDMQSPLYATIVSTMYGDKELWLPLSGTEHNVSSESEIDRSIAMAGTNFAPFIPAKPRRDLNDLLEHWQVHPSGMWENSEGPEGFHAVSNEDDSIVAYFHEISDAYRWRLDMINRDLNG